MVCCIFFLITFTFLLMELYPPHYVQEPPPSYYLRFNQTKLVDGYELTIRAITPHQIKPSNLGWMIVDNNGVLLMQNTFPTKSGQDSGTIDENITIAWFDKDQNKRLSINDTVYIYTNGEDLEGSEFRLGFPEEDWFNLIGQVVLY